ncbi:MAG: glycosyltransferase [Pseudomonadota bacterium]
MTRAVVASNGYVDGPAQALRDFLVGRGHAVTTVFHPLAVEDGTAHTLTRYEDGHVVEQRRVRVPLRPPASYAVDPLVPLRIPRADVWFGFNPLAAARGLAERRLGRAGRVVQWSVDFVPDRFGPGSPLTRLYDAVDRLACTRADAWVELSAEARDARDARHGIRRDPARTHVVPMGAWLGRTATAPPDAHGRRRVVYLGHLVPRQGVDVLLDALVLLRARGEEVAADVIGTGPEETALRARAAALHLGDAVRFHGFVADHRDVERLLAGGSIAVAPYRSDPASFTRFADPGKLKAYLGAGLPIVLTDVPPNAAELAAQAGAELVADDPAALADAIARGLADPEAWGRRRAAARAYARRFDWETLLGGLLAALGLEGAEDAGATR